MLKLRGCPKCKEGAVIKDRDQYGWYEYCLQCGYLHDLENKVELGQQQAFRGKKRGRRITASNKGK